MSHELPNGTIVRTDRYGVIEDWVKESPNNWRSMSGGGSASDKWITRALETGVGTELDDPEESEREAYSDEVY
jgi:hypothetical protein